ncbi:hypothetical protein Pla163_11780 [Planctomycetes bacterium Pla163]|uniref:Uncharacterized protein n=1 Tax=Rohdeia mirabilis TaxID=2528008 RepID=A0A518CY05_9BACT|nr:hypothetical protein Pla163_11780 [Planctomycetes bacterium Pla163]
MPYSTRTIGYHCELLHPPGPVDPNLVQRVHNGLFASPDPLYKSFAVNHDGCALSNIAVRPGAVSQAAFLVDRYRFNEEGTGLTPDEFADRVTTLASQISEAKGLSIFTGQVVTLRTLVNPRAYPTALELLGEGVLRWNAEENSLGRPVGGLGLRLVLPATPEYPNTFNVRIETIANDRRSLFLENQGTFPPQPVREGLASVRAHIDATYRFLTGPVLDLLAQRDRSDGTDADADARDSGGEGH